MTWIFNCCILVFSLIIFAYLYTKQKFNYWKNLRVPQISPIIFVGNVGNLLIKKSLGEMLKDLYERSDGLPYVGFYIFTKPCLLIRDPRLIKRILIKDFNYFNDRFLSVASHDRIGDANLFLLKNPHWKLVRTHLTPVYTSGKLKKLFQLIDNVGDDLVTLMESLQLEGDGQEVEVKELSARYVAEAIATAAFGVRANCLNSPTAEFYKMACKMFENTYKRNLKLIAVTLAQDLLKPFKMKIIPIKTTNFLRKLLWEVMEERERSNFQRGDFVDTLIQLRINKAEIFDKDFDFDGDNLLAQAAVFFIAGFETASSALSFTLYEIALQTKIQDRLRAEIIDGLAKTDGKVTYELATNLPYLDMVIAEVLRKYPPVPVLDRVTKEDYRIPDSNIILKKGTPIMIPLMGLHYNPEHFSNPETFNPERFSEINKKSIFPCTYLPFGSGPHNCLGGRIGLFKIKIGLIKLLSRYKFSTCKKTAIPIRLTKKAMLTTVDGGIFLHVKKL